MTATATRPSEETLAKAEEQREQIHAAKAAEPKVEAKPDPKPSQKTAKAETAPKEAKPRKPAKAKSDKMSAKQAAVEILTKAGAPLPLDELAAQIIAHPKVKLAGKTPAATIAAMFYVDVKKPGGLFKRTSAKKPTFTLR